MTTAIDFPTTLPAALQGTLEEEIHEAWVDDNSAVGATRRRARFTRALRMFKYSIYITEAQRIILDAFYITTLSNGVLSFNWTHPKSGTSFEVQFAGKPVPKHSDGDDYYVDVEIHEI